MGLEWLGRFIDEPKRMWKRYLYYGPIFIWALLKYRFKFKCKTFKIELYILDLNIIIAKREGMKTALITGVAEEGGSYLVELLLSQGYIVHGLKNNYQIVHASSVTDSSLELINKRYKLHFCDFSNLINFIAYDTRNTTRRNL